MRFTAVLRSLCVLPFILGKESFIVSAEGGSAQEVKLFTFGPFRVQVNFKTNDLLVTTVTGEEEKTVLRSLGAGSSWVRAGLSPLSVEEFDGGVFEFSDGCYPDIWIPSRANPNAPRWFRRPAPQHRDCFLTLQQTITGVETLPEEKEGIVIRGSLHGQKGDSPFTLSYSFELSTSSLAGEAAPPQLEFNLEADKVEPQQSEIPVVDRLVLTLGFSDKRNDNGDLLDQEAIYGFGEQPTNINMRGKVFPTVVMENGIGRGDQPISTTVNLISSSPASGAHYSTYAPLPGFITSAGRMLLLHNSEYSLWDLTEDKMAIHTVAFHPDTPDKLVRRFRLHGHTGSFSTPLGAIEALTVHTGRPRPLPKWIYTNGAVMGLTGGLSAVTEIYDNLKKWEVPVAALWLQDWTGLRFDRIGSRLWWNWESDGDHYADWRGFSDKLFEEGVRLMSYINPYLSNSVADKKKNAQRNLFEEARERGFLVEKRTEKGLEPYIQTSGSKEFSYGTVDLFNPDAAAWYMDVIRCNVMGICECEQQGQESCRPTVYGWMADFSESLSFNAITYQDKEGREKEDAVARHNHYVEAWQKLNKEATKGYDDVVPFTRAGWTRTPGLTRLMWHGDQFVTAWENDGMTSALRSSLSCGLSGLALTHSDVGGYTALKVPVVGNLPGFRSSELFNIQRSKEVLLRWSEMSAFSDVIMRTHVGTSPEESHQVYTDPETAMAFARAVRWHQALSSYREHLIANAALRGHPLTRHLVLEFPQDPQVRDLSLQFMVGSCLLVAPVLLEEANSVDVYLPASSWRHVWTGKAFEKSAGGGWEQVEAPLGSPAVFVRVGYVDGPIACETVEASLLAVAVKTK